MKRSLHRLGPLERRQALEAALVRMMAHPQRYRPFVVLEHRVTRRFVQFAGSLGESLLFDVPALDKSIRLGPGSDASVYSEAVRLGFETLAALVFDRTSPKNHERAIDTSDLILTESIDGDEGDRPSAAKAS